MRRPHLTLTLSLTLAATSLAQQAVHRQWLRHDDGSGHSDDYGLHSAVSDLGLVCTTGMATNADGVFEILTVLRNANGQKLWSKTYIGDGGGGDIGYQAAFTPDGNILIAGDSVGAGTDYDIVLLKYDLAGNLLWESRYDGPANAFDGLSGARTLVVDSNGDAMLTGYSVGVGTHYDLVVLRYSANGNLLWSDRINGSANSTDTAFALRIDANHDILIGGETTDAISGRDILILKYDAAGNQLWQHQYNHQGASFDFVWAGELDAAGNFVICGLTESGGTEDDAIVQKYDTNGNLLWTSVFNGVHNGNDGAFGLAVSPQGRVAITGYVQKSYEWNAFTQLYDSAGGLLWTTEFETSEPYLGNDDGIECRFDANENLYVTGVGWNGPEHGYDAFLVRYALSGQITFQDIIDGPAHGDEWGLTLTLDAAGAPYVTGYTQRGGQHQDMLVIKWGMKAPIVPTLDGNPGPESEPPPTSLRRSSRFGLGASAQPYRPQPVQRLPLPMRAPE